MNAPLTAHPLPPYRHTPLFPLGKDTTPYRKISAEGLRVERVLGEEVLVAPREALRALAEAAFTDVNHLLRPAHLAAVQRTTVGSRKTRRSIRSHARHRRDRGCFKGRRRRVTQRAN